MSILRFAVPRERAVVPAPLARARRASAAVAALLAIAAAGAAIGGAPAASGAALVVSAGVGALLAVLLGSMSSDRRGRRRFVGIGLVLVAASSAALVPAAVVPAGASLGIGVVLIAMTAAAWLADAGVGGSASVASALIVAVSGAGAAAIFGVPATIGLLVLAVVATIVAPETVRVPRTPVFVNVGLPTLSGRTAGLPVLLVLATVLALRQSGPILAAVVAASLTAAGFALVARRRRGNAGATLSPARSRAYRRAVGVFDSSASPAPVLGGVVTTVDEVRAAVAGAREKGLGVAMHSTGHAAMSLGDLRRDALLKVAMNGAVEVDSARRLVRVPAGRAWTDVVSELAPHGLAVPHGSSGHVGVVGYLTRGGLSAYGRHTGVAANHLESVELVRADGTVVVTSRTCEPDLFWAVRGGGGGFGVVSAVTVRAFAPGEIVTGTTLWEVSDAAAVARAWAEWTVTAPSAITTSLRILTIPPLPGMPLRLTRRPLLVVDGTAVDGDVTARQASSDLLERLRAAARPVLDTWHPSGVAEVPHTHMDPPFSPSHSSQHALLGARPADDADQAGAIVEAFLDTAARPGTGVAIAELRQLGGALAEPAPDGGAVSHYRGAFSWLAIALHGRSGANVAQEGIARAWGRLAPWATGFTAPTLAVERNRPARSFPAETARRVAAVRAAVDPHGVFATDVLPAARPH